MRLPAGGSVLLIGGVVLGLALVLAGGCGVARDFTLREASDSTARAVVVGRRADFSQVPGAQQLSGGTFAWGFGTGWAPGAEALPGTTLVVGEAFLVRPARLSPEGVTRSLSREISTTFIAGIPIRTVPTATYSVNAGSGSTVRALCEETLDAWGPLVFVAAVGEFERLDLLNPIGDVEPDAVAASFRDTHAVFVLAAGRGARLSPKADLILAMMPEGADVDTHIRMEGAVGVLASDDRGGLDQPEALATGVVRVGRLGPGSLLRRAEWRVFAIEQVGRP